MYKLLGKINSMFHHIEPIICELRHKYFFDGGISCCTQDIRRRGSLETYL
jgi:hypothetical protein